MSAISLAVAKEFLQISHSAQNNVLQILIDTAEDFVAKHLGVEFSQTSYSEILDGGVPYLRPSHQPLVSVTSVVDMFGELGDIDVTPAGSGLIHYADADGKRIGPWPEGIARFNLTYTAGYSALPAALKTAVLMLVSRAYNARSGEGSSGAAGASMQLASLMSSDIAALIRPYSRRRVAGV
jgi:uncharacterized phiE125 gp8 family phage protein